MSNQPASLHGPPTDSPAPLRAFVALELDATMRTRVAELVEALRGELKGVRWVSPANLHLTLRFLGSSAPAALERLDGALVAAAADCPPAEVRVAGVGFFPERGAPRVLWLGLALPEPVMALQRACEAAARAAGYEPETRPFRSHLTLGRFAQGAPRPRPRDVDLGTTRLDQLVLVRSELRRGGALHTVLSRHALGRHA